MPLTVRIPDDLRDRIDAERGDVPRERWIRRVLEQALSDSPTGGDARERRIPSAAEVHAQPALAHSRRVGLERQAKLNAAKDKR